MIKAIETKYKGYRFRSRLEARWAVFFDALGVEWEYEPEGFKLDNEDYYLPDFKIRHGVHDFYVEIKGVKPNENEIQKGKQVAHQTERAFYFLTGIPDPTDTICGMPEFAGLCFIPASCDFMFSGDAHHSFFEYYTNELPDFLSGEGVDVLEFKNVFHADSEYYARKYKASHKNHCDLGRLSIIGRDAPLFMTRSMRRGSYEKRIVLACAEARSARFEHGETP